MSKGEFSSDTVAAMPDTDHVDLADDTSSAEGTPTAADGASSGESTASPGRKRPSLARLATVGLIPVLAVAAAATAGCLKWHQWTLTQAQLPSSETIAAASDAAIAMLSYKPDSVAADLEHAGDRLTGDFRHTFSQLAHDVVIPGAKEKRVSATATVPAAASISATSSKAEVLVFVDQTIVIGDDAPYATASSVLVSLEKSDGRWLVSAFTPQ